MELDIDFVDCLQAIAERDIDLILIEEFNVSDQFSLWFSEQLGLISASRFKARHSVFNSDGESDIVLRAWHEDKWVGIFIENKINALEQPLQADRYVIRGKASVETGEFSSFKTVIVAPQRYLSSLSSTSVYQHQVNYESISQWFGEQQGRRYKWKQHLVNEAVDQNRRPYKLVPDPAKTRFQIAYWNHVRDNHPSIKMAKPGLRGSSAWIILKGFDFPKGVHLDHKFGSGTMELGFEHRKIEEVLALKPDWTSEGVTVIQRGGTASLVINVPEIDMDSPFEEQRAKVEDALAAAHRLTLFANLLEPHVQSKFAGSFSDLVPLEKVEPLSTDEVTELRREEEPQEDAS